VSTDTHGLLTPAAFTTLTGRTAPSQEALDAALDVIEDYCRWPVIQTTRTVDIEVENCRSRAIDLPGMHVTDVSSVTVAADYGPDTVPLKWRYTTSGILRAISGLWPVGVVTVTFTSGYPPAPGGIWLTVAALAERVQLQAGVTQRLESAGGISTNTSYGGMSGFMLSDADMAVLNPYRILVVR